MCNPSDLSSKSVLTSSVLRSTTSCIPCKTVFEKPPKQLNLEELNSSDVAALKTNDPFMYYSIPMLKKAAVRQAEFDPSTLDSSASLSKPACGKHDEAGENERVPHIVSRKCRISFECHAYILLEDHFSGIDVSETAEVDSGFDFFLSSLEKCQK
ncbi:hypothetical protein ACHAW6_009590 [Cyclotella cf. meneghiniana]